MVKVFALNKKSIVVIAALTITAIGTVALFDRLSKLVDERLKQCVSLARELSGVVST
jgi:hypothetical protein